MFLEKNIKGHLGLLVEAHDLGAPCLPVPGDRTQRPVRFAQRLVVLPQRRGGRRRDEQSIALPLGDDTFFGSDDDQQCLGASGGELLAQRAHRVARCRQLRLQPIERRRLRAVPPLWPFWEPRLAR